MKALKKWFSLLLASGMLLATSPQAPAQVTPVVFVLTLGIVGCCITVFVIKKAPGTPAFHTFVLEKTLDLKAGQWTAIATNTGRMTLEHAFPLFEVEMNDYPGASFRLREIPLQMFRSEWAATSTGARAIPQEP